MRSGPQRLTARFTAAGVTVLSGRVEVGMRLAGYGYGTDLVSSGAQRPTANANRVVYRDGGMTQWYANGPLGVEQGFTLAARPPGRQPGPSRQPPLTFVLAVSGSARMASADGGVVFSRAGDSVAYRDLVVTDARGRQLPARVSLARRRVLVQVDDVGARYPVTVDPVFQQQAKLTASDGISSDQLGYSVAVSGNVVVAGAPDANSYQGVAYVFTEPAGGWATETQAAKLTATGSTNFGYSVAVDAGTVVVGAEATSNFTGAAYVFTEPGGGWTGNLTPSATLAASDGGNQDQFGYSVAVSGSTVAVGEPDISTFQGEAYVFTKPGGGWTGSLIFESAKLFAADGANDYYFGTSVAVSGSTVVVGAPLAKIGSRTDGAAYVFTMPGGGWTGSPTQSAKLIAAGTDTGDDLGQSVAVDGGTVVAGAPTMTVGANADQGEALVFAEPGGGWSGTPTQSASLAATAGTANDKLGYSVAVDGSTVVAGAPHPTFGPSAAQGSAYVFAEPGGGWSGTITQSAKITAADGAVGDHFGWAAGASDGEIAVGADNARIGSNGGQGAAYIFSAPAAQPPPRPPYQWSGFTAPRGGSRWRAGSVVHVAIALDYPGGTPVQSWLAAELAANCEVTVQASGAQPLRPHCLRFDKATGRFRYDWQLAGRRYGRDTLQVRATYPTQASRQEGITITRG